MTISRRAALAAMATSLAAGAAIAQIREGQKKVPDEAAAIAIAEKASLDLIGGEAKLAEARPFTASGHGDVWLVISRPVPDPKNPSHKRAIVVQLSSTSGEVLDISTAD